MTIYFRNNKITLVHPQNFNDSFEVLPYVDIDKLHSIHQSFDVNQARRYIRIAKEREFTAEEVNHIGGINAVEQLKMFARILRNQDDENIFLENFDRNSDHGFEEVRTRLLYYCV